MGAVMGGGVGLTIGFIFGSWSIIRGGAGPRGALSTLSQYMLSSAATFSFFLAIGSTLVLTQLAKVIRSDAIPAQFQAAQLQLASPVYAVHSRAEGLQVMKARWEAERRRLASNKE
ncbi:reactive mitochondrial oxygen species modulator 1-domain-containing protein [Gymnopilus junonius]|uniref:Reactive mitochondrial oxygen species modulator 1-domain-containing protein n=1 Tax=Gymnopilus junonius TaxID=109634 RepID=A0A9P5NXN2_GYMJU|nr:reactive mitochondrial oxygen species modulator 1-domain-containing protein [Gymnopilus junonius]